MVLEQEGWLAVKVLSEEP